MDDGGLIALTVQAVAQAVGVRAPLICKRLRDRKRAVRLVADSVARDLCTVLDEAAVFGDPRADLCALLDAARAFAHRLLLPYPALAQGASTSDKEPAGWSTPPRHSRSPPSRRPGTSRKPMSTGIVTGQLRVPGGSVPVDPSGDHSRAGRQRDPLTAAGCERLFTEQSLRRARQPPGLAALRDYVRAGDTVVVVALARLGQSLSGIIRTVETLTEAGVLLRSLREGVDSSVVGRMLAGIFAALAAYERELMHERACCPRRPSPPPTHLAAHPSSPRHRPARSARSANAASRSPTSSQTTASPAPTIYRALNAGTEPASI